MAVEKSNGKKILDELLGDLSKSSAGKQMVLGTSMGWLTGFVAMKIGKVAAVVAGGSILILEIAHHKGYLKINWDKVYDDADKYVDKIEKDVTGKGPGVLDKLERYVDRKLDKVENKIDKMEKKIKSNPTVRKWYHSLVNNGENGGGYKLQELHIFIASFAAGVAFGFASA